MCVEQGGRLGRIALRQGLHLLLGGKLVVAQHQQGLHIGLEGGATGAGQRGGVRLGKGGLGGIKVGVRGAVGRVEQDVAQRLAALQALGIHLGQAGDHRLLGQFRKSRSLARYKNKAASA